MSRVSDRSALIQAYLKFSPFIFLFLIWFLRWNVVCFERVPVPLSIELEFDMLAGCMVVRRHAGFWTFLWFVCFCYLADTWRRTTFDNPELGESGVEAAIVFSFFSIGTFVRTSTSLYAIHSPPNLKMDELDLHEVSIIN